MTKVYFFDLLENKVNIDLLLSCLPVSFKERVEKYTLEEDKKRSIIAYYVLYKYLIKDFDYNQSDMVLKENKYQKPSLSGINFNISHSHNYVCVIISAGECGIDIEYVNENKDYKKIARKVLKNKDYQDFLISNDIEKVVKKWTLMEAYFKTIGTGIKYKNMILDIDMPYLEKTIINKNSEKYCVAIFSQHENIELIEVKM